MTKFVDAYICGACGYDLRQQWDHGCDDRCLGCIDKAKRKLGQTPVFASPLPTDTDAIEKERQQALIFHCCNHCGRPQQECECPFDHGY